MLRSAHDVVGRFALSLQQQVGLADGVGLGVDPLAEKVGGNLLVVLDARVGVVRVLPCVGGWQLGDQEIQ